MCTTLRDNEGLGPPSTGHDSCSAGRRSLLHLWNFSLHPGRQQIYNPQTPMTPPHTPSDPMLSLALYLVTLFLLQPFSCQTEIKVARGLSSSLPVHRAKW